MPEGQAFSPDEQRPNEETPMPRSEKLRDQLAEEARSQLDRDTATSPGVATGSSDPGSREAIDKFHAAQRAEAQKLVDDARNTSLEDREAA